MKHTKLTQGELRYNKTKKSFEQLVKQTVKQYHCSRAQAQTKLAEAGIFFPDPQDYYELNILQYYKKRIKNNLCGTAEPTS